jgi:flavin reductase (DIM6/NTAB) family NADH-FMN oxidoreductase RutF
MTKAPIALPDTYRVINPGCVVAVSVGDGRDDNLFALTWNMPVRKNPPLMAMLSGKRHYSYPFIERTGQFAINLLDARDVDAMLGSGSVSGHKVDDKFGLLGLTREPADVIAAPLVAEAVANLECEVERIVDLDSSALILGRVVAARAATEHFHDGHWTFDNGLQLLHHLSGKRFCTSERVVEGTKPG